MKKLIVFIFSIVLFGSCSSEKILSERLTHDWNINYLDNDDVKNSFTTIEDYQYINEKPNNVLSNELENESLTASTKTVITNNKKELTSLLRKVRELELDEDCDNIIFKNADELSAKVIEITTDVVKYKRCDNLDGPLISVSKNEILMIRYKNGTKEIFKGNVKKTLEEDLKTSNNKDLKTESLALTSMITGILACLLPLSFLAVIFLVLSLVLSLIGLTRISKSPDKLKGKGFGIAGFILGVIAGLGVLILTA